MDNKTLNYQNKNLVKNKQMNQGCNMQKKIKNFIINFKIKNFIINFKIINLYLNSDFFVFLIKTLQYNINTLL